MIRIRKLIALAAFSLALAPAAEARAQSSSPQSIQAGEYGMSRWRGSRNGQLLNDAVRYYGFRPNRLTNRQMDAIQETWYELFGSTRRTLTRAQATAVVYMALVHPYEDEGFYDDGRPGRPGGWDRPGGGHDRPGGGRNDRPGGGYDNVPPYRGDVCLQMESDAYRLGNMISAPGVNSGLFIVDPEKGQARTLARQIQQRAIECRATGVADRAAEVLTALSAPLPGRADLERRVDVLKEAIQQHTRRR